MTRLAIAALSLLVLSACGGTGHHNSTPGSVTDKVSSASGYLGAVLDQPILLKPASADAVFQSSRGGATTLAKLGEGKLMLLYFGYTHCPDICPTTMADLSQALLSLPVQIQNKTQVVFITSDPARDTPADMAKWLKQVSSAVLPLPFVGLTASVAQIDRVAESVGVPLEPPTKLPDGTVSVVHGAQTLAFLNGKASLMWLADAAQSDPGQSPYAHDITKLLLSNG